MNKNLQSLLKDVVLNEEVNQNVRLKALDSILELFPDSRSDIKSYLENQTKTKSTVTNQLALSALDFLEE